MIEIINLCKSFDDHKVLDNLNLNINTGETTVIIGRSGCGKSVLLKHIIGILKPDSGQILIDNKDITKMDEKEISALVRKFFPLTPKGIIDYLKLRRPIYRKTAQGGHFGRDLPEFTLEELRKVDALKQAARACK